MNAPDYLLIGHMTADITPHGRILGGTVSYAARTISAFGLRVGVLTSADPNDPLIDVLSPYVDDLVVIPAESTSTFENIYTETGRQQMIRGVAKKLTWEHLPEHWRKASMVHFAPLTGEIDPAHWFNKFPDARTLMTAQGLLRVWGDDDVVRFKSWLDHDALQHLDWLVLSEEDIAQAPHLEQAYVDAANHLVMTRAENGGTYYHNGQTQTYITPQVEVIQPTGAGDVFAAGLLVGLHLSGGDVAASLALGAQLGAIAVTRDGWDGAPTPEEVQSALKSSGVTA